MWFTFAVSLSTVSTGPRAERFERRSEDAAVLDGSGFEGVDLTAEASHSSVGRSQNVGGFASRYHAGSEERQRVRAADGRTVEKDVIEDERGIRTKRPKEGERSGNHSRREDCRDMSPHTRYVRFVISLQLYRYIGEYADYIIHINNAFHSQC